MERERPQLLIRWERESVRARDRESRLAALVLHLSFITMILISPRMFTGQPLSAAELELIRPDVTVLYLPSDALPIPEPQTPPDLTPEERRRAVTRGALTIDPDELRRIIAPPSPPDGSAAPPSLPPGRPGLAAPAPGRGPRMPESSGGEPELSRNQIARLEDLPEIQRDPNSTLQLPRQSPGRTIEEALRQGEGSSGRSTRALPGDNGLGGQVQPNFNTPLPTILSDTRGVDFTPYLIRLLRKVRANWYATIPESARWGEQGRVVIVFTIMPDGAVPPAHPTIVATSGRSHLDRPALAAIRGAQPFPPLPQEFDGPNIVLQFTFLYNLPLDYAGP
jgi:TonB family protein